MAGSLNLGELYAKLSVNYSDLHLAELEARKFVEKTKKGFESIAKTGERLKSVGTKMSAFVTVPLLGAASASLKFSQDFDKSIREVNSLLDSADKDFGGLKDQVRGVATALGLDLVEAAQAAYEAIGAGVPKDNLVDFLNVAGKAAIGGVTTMKTVVDGLTTVTNAWGDSAGDAQQIADEMFIAVKYGKVTFDQMAASMKDVGGLGPELGVSFKEVAAASAVMTAQGIPQSVAMTQMKAAMSALLGPNEEMTKLLKKAGIESVRTSVKQKGLAGTYNLLRKASDKSGISFEKSVGSVEALNFTLKTTGANAGKFKTAMEQVANAGGSLDAAFKELDQARAFDKLLNNLKALGTQIGEILMPVLIPIVEQFTAWITQASELDPGLLRIGVTIGAVTAALGPLMLGVGSLLAVIAPAIAAAGGFGAALAGLAAMAAPVVLAVAAIGAAGYLLYKNWDQVKGFVMGIVNSIVGYFQKWANNNQDVINDILAAWGPFVESAKGLWTAIYNAVSESVSGIITWLDEMLAPIGGLQGAWEVLKESVGDVLSVMGIALSEFIKAVTTGFNLIAEVVRGEFDVWNTLKFTINEAFEAVKGYLGELWESFKKTFADIVNHIKNIDWSGLGKDLMQGLADGIKQYSGLPMDAANKAADQLNIGVEKKFEVESPSKVFARIGGFLMEGLAQGITQNTNSAVAAVIAASESVLNTAGEKLSAEEMRKRLSGGIMDLNKDLTLNPQFSQGVGGDMAKYDLEIEKEKAYYAQSLELLKQAEAARIESVRPYNELREQMEKQHQVKLGEFERQRLESQLNAASSFFGNLAKLQNSENKKMAAIGKAAAIAQATIDTYKAATGAYSAMASIPYVGPALGIAAAGAAIVAGMANVSAIRSQKAYNAGGHIPSGQIGLVGEKRGELVSGPANVFSAQNTHELFNSNRSGGGSTKVLVEVYNFGGRNVEVEQSGEDDEKKIKIFIDRTKASIASDARRGDGVVDRAFKDRFKLQDSA